MAAKVKYYYVSLELQENCISTRDHGVCIALNPLDAIEKIAQDADFSTGKYIIREIRLIEEC